MTKDEKRLKKVGRGKRKVDLKKEAFQGGKNGEKSKLREAIEAQTTKEGLRRGGKMEDTGGRKGESVRGKSGEKESPTSLWREELGGSETTGFKN